MRRLPPVFLLHGGADNSVPAIGALDFADALQRAGVTAAVKVYPGKSHTDPIIEDLLYADEVRESQCRSPACASARHPDGKNQHALPPACALRCSS